MTEEEEVWHEIRDALHSLAEQGEKQTALLEKMVKQGTRRGVYGRVAILGGVMTSIIAAVALSLSVAVAYGRVSGIPERAWEIAAALGLAIVFGFVIGVSSEIELWKRPH